jgi:hypothetical protein
MGLVQSQKDTSEDTIEVDGFVFAIENRLKSLIPVYGNLIVDFKKAFFAEIFTVRFSRQGAC